jgi:hypothetical protein
MQNMFFDEILNIFGILTDFLADLGLPLGSGDWFFIIYTLIWIIIVVIVRKKSSPY